MDEETKASKDSENERLKIFHVSETEEVLGLEMSVSERNVRKGVALILTRKHEDEVLIVRSDEGLKLMHLRYEIDAETHHKTWLMFKRAPELRPYYAAIKSWCEANNLSWADKVHKSDKYMSIALDPVIDEITGKILSVNKDVFKVKSLDVGSNNTNLSLAISDLNHPFLLAFFGLPLAISIGLLPFYEAFRLPYVGVPSFQAIDWPETFLVVFISVGIFYIRYLNRKKQNRNSMSKMKIYLLRTALFLIICLTFFTY